MQSPQPPQTLPPAAEAVAQPQPPQPLQPAAAAETSGDFLGLLGEPDELYRLYDFYGRPLREELPADGKLKMYRYGIARCIGQRLGSGGFKVHKWLEDPFTGAPINEADDTFRDL